MNNTEVGEGGLNASFAGALGVPVIFAAGDQAFADQFAALTGAVTISTKVAIGQQVARLVHPDEVNRRLHEGTTKALENMSQSQIFDIGSPVTIRMRFASTTRPDILQAIPGMKRIDGYTVEYDADTMDEAYRLIRLMYKYISW